jgi:hypothetical protein
MGAYSRVCQPIHLSGVVPTPERAYNIESVEVSSKNPIWKVSHGVFVATVAVVVNVRLCLIPGSGE